MVAQLLSQWAADAAAGGGPFTMTAPAGNPRRAKSDERSRPVNPKPSSSPLRLLHTPPCHRALPLFP
jgi:hypothetical protein